MRRKDREITNINEIYQIMDSCNCCRLGFVDDGQAYIVPMSFGYTKADGEIVLYFHSASQGRKISLIPQAGPVCFEMDTGFKLTKGEVACEYSANYQSIIGYGNVSFVQPTAEKIKALNVIMHHYTNNDDWSFSGPDFEAACIFKLTVTNISCKVH